MKIISQNNRILINSDNIDMIYIRDGETDGTYEIVARKNSMTITLSVYSTEQQAIDELNHIASLINTRHCYIYSMGQSTVQNTEKESKEIVEKAKIKDEYLKLIVGLAGDYDGFYNPETKQGNAEDLAGLIDELVHYAICALKNDPTELPLFEG